MKPVVRVDVRVPAQVFQENDMFIAYSPTFDVSSQGESIESARRNLVEALAGFIISCHEMGTLPQVMKDAGFVPCDPGAVVLPDEDDGDFVDVPLPFMLADSDHSECRA